MSPEASSVTIYVELVDEGVDVRRPVEAVQLSESTYEIPSSTQVPEEEQWLFQPGSVVRCEVRRFYEGEHLVAVEEVRRAV